MNANDLDKKIEFLEPVLYFGHLPPSFMCKIVIIISCLKVKYQMNIYFLFKANVKLSDSLFAFSAACQVCQPFYQVFYFNSNLFLFESLIWSREPLCLFYLSYLFLFGKRIGNRFKLVSYCNSLLLIEH